MFINDSSVFDYWSEMQERMHERMCEREKGVTLRGARNFREFEDLPKEIRNRFVFKDDDDAWIYTQEIFAAKKVMADRLVAIGYKTKMALNSTSEATRRKALKELMYNIAFDTAEWLDSAVVDEVLIKFFLDEKFKLT